MTEDLNIVLEHAREARVPTENFKTYKNSTDLAKFVSWAAGKWKYREVTQRPAANGRRLHAQTPRSPAGRRRVRRPHPPADGDSSPPPAEGQAQIWLHAKGSEEPRGRGREPFGEAPEGCGIVGALVPAEERDHRDIHKQLPAEGASFGK